MDMLTVFPNATIKAAGPVSGKFLNLGINRFIDACNYAKESNNSLGRACLK